MTQPGDYSEIIAAACPDLEISTDEGILEDYGRDWTRFREPSASAVLFPRSVAQLQRLVRVASRERIPLVPSGGRTGLSGGALATSGEVVVSFDRMRRILDFNPIDRNLTVQAGVVTADVQSFARDQGLYYPVSFASEGSSQIGGNVATNAGGIRVLRYGLTRDQVSGLKVVTGTGELLDCNRGLVKNASGYDLRHLLVASEGTLGLIAEVTLKLSDPPLPSRVMLLGVEHMGALMKVFAALRGSLGLSAFEFFTDQALAHVMRGQGLPRPFEAAPPLYALTEFDCPDAATETRAIGVFEQCLEQGWLRDGVISQSGEQAARLWRYREGISESISHFPPYKNDLSVRVSQVPEFLEGLDDVVRNADPELEVVWYGHIGDGNLHMNILKPADMSLENFEQRSHDISREAYALTRAAGGSVSAEHGIGLLKQPWLSECRSQAEIELMKQIKKVFDPAGILNPGKLL